jgi:hypothetical protein
MRTGASYRKFLFLILLLAAGLSSCTEKISIKLDETYTRLVVDGGISTDTTAYRVDLTRTADYFYNSPIPRETGATLSLSDGSQTYPMHETDPGVSGIYETDSTFAAQIGKTYTLSIDLKANIGGQSHYEASCMTEPVTHLDSIGFIFQPDWGKDGVWEITVYAQEPGNEVNYYMFNYYRNDTLMSDSISKVVVSDDKYFNGSYINGLAAIYIDNTNGWETIHPGDVITVRMSGITKEYFDFVTQVQQAGLNIPFFSGPPANVQGNVNNGGIGFFSASSNTWAAKVVPELGKK